MSASSLAKIRKDTDWEAGPWTCDGNIWVCVGGREKIVGKVWLRTGEVEVFWVVPLRLNKVIDALTHPDE